MDNISRAKGMLTKAWNTGKYTEKDFRANIGEILKNAHLNAVEYYEVLPYVSKVVSKAPTRKQPKKHDHKVWCVYFYFLSEKDVYPVYIGKTYDVEKRRKQHIYEDKKYEKVKYVLFMRFPTESDALAYEKYYTQHFQPSWNKDNKEEPPKFFKLPMQPISVYVVDTDTVEGIHRHRYELNQTAKLVCNFQTKIEEISEKSH